VDEALIILAEENAEVIQAVSKIQRFGSDPQHIKELEKEIGDVIAMMTVLSHHSIIDAEKVMRRVPIKLRKLKKYSNIKELDDIIESL
jgi:NTP pyrophosphatase (non-canonical NTP hydrolase)